MGTFSEYSEDQAAGFFQVSVAIYHSSWRHISKYTSLIAFFLINSDFQWYVILCFVWIGLQKERLYETSCILFNIL